MMSLNVGLRTWAMLLVAGAGLAACGGPTGKVPDGALSGPTAVSGKRSFHVALDAGILLDYELEVKMSTVDGKSCYTFLTGYLTNNSQRTLSRRSVLDFIVVYQGKMLFRDLSNPTADIPPGGRAMFTMVDSPVHNKHCPRYDRIDVSLRKVLLD